MMSEVGPDCHAMWLSRFFRCQSRCIIAHLTRSPSHLPKAPMPTLFEHEFTPDDLRRLTGSLDQLAGIRLYELSDGKARGMRAADIWTGSGLRFTVWLDRALDIGPAEFAGKPLAWVYPALGTPAQFE